MRSMFASLIQAQRFWWVLTQVDSSGSSAFMHGTVSLDLRALAFLFASREVWVPHLYQRASDAGMWEHSGCSSDRC